MASFLLRSSCRTRPMYAPPRPIARRTFTATRYHARQSSRPVTSATQPGSIRTISLLALITLGLGAYYYAVSAKTRAAASSTHVTAPKSSPIDPNALLDWKRAPVLPGLDVEAATAKLREEEVTRTFSSASGEATVTRFDALRLSAYAPAEDQMTFEQRHITKGDDWMFWGVYDGHAGWYTSALLKRTLISHVARDLRALFTSSANMPTDSAAVTASLKSTFLTLDKDIIEDALSALQTAKSHTETISRIAPAGSGSCALLAMHDPTTDILRVACVGDSRAVLGRRSSPSSAQYDTHILSIDQNGFNETEQARIAMAHPNEPDILSGSEMRLLGIAVTRAFGDNRWKWPVEALQKWQKDYYGKGPRPKYLTPPYMTAEPEVMELKVQKGDFLVMASDGFWDKVSNEEAVSAVASWLERRKGIKGWKKTKDTPASTTKLPRTISRESTPNLKDDLVVEDENAATHLVRNALGGKDRDMFCSLVSMEPRDACDVRDDITVQVVFFGDLD